MKRMQKPEYQNTIARSCRAQGKGLHTGCAVTIRFEAAPENTGIRFVAKEWSLAAVANNVINTSRCTVLGSGANRIGTVEHCLSAASAFGIDNLLIHIEGEEMPALDGSASSYCELFSQCGTVVQNQPRRVITLQAPVYASAGDAQVVALPYEGERYSVVLDYAHPMVGTQFCDFLMDKERYIKEIAPARTFGFWEEVRNLLEQNLAKGGDVENALIIMPDGYSTPLRLKDEPVRHKCLDLIGDLALVGAKVNAHIISIKAGHTLNIELAKKLALLGGL